MYNPSGFDDSDLLLDPEERQRSMPGAPQNVKLNMGLDSVRQAQMANTNPMNAVSQEPGKDFLAGYLQKGGMEEGETAFNPFKFFGGKAMEQGDKARQGELMEEPDAGLGAANNMLRYRQRQMEMMKQLGL
tara:strand:- start:444 stop:836 length:393 start_codon:yes stop_codon:yes gene_type:complete